MSFCASWNDLIAPAKIPTPNTEPARTAFTNLPKWNGNLGNTLDAFADNARGLNTEDMLGKSQNNNSITAHLLALQFYNKY